MLEGIFLQISIIFGIVALTAVIVHWLRQPFLIAYIITGLLCGPMVFNLIQPETDFYHSFSQFGVVLLLFVLGLSLNFSHLKKIGKVAIMIAVGQLILTAAVGLVVLELFNFSFISAIYLAVAMTFSSTIVIVKLLADKQETDSLYGQNVIGLMLVQDVIAIVLMLLIPLLSNDQTVLSQALLLWVLKAFVLFAIIYTLARFVLKSILDKIAKSGEFLFIFTIAWCFGIAGLAHWGGFSLEIGALMAGLSLGATPYSFEISSKIKPLRDFFIMIFFIILGAQMSLKDIDQVLWPGIVMSLFVLIGNPIILYFLYRFNKFSRRNSLLIGLCAAQVSEFGFILLFVGQSFGHVLPRQIGVYTFVALVTIFISSYMLTYNKYIYRWLTPFFRLFGRDRQSSVPADEIKKKVDVWVFGYHRVGWKLCESLKKQKKKFAVVDFNPEACKRIIDLGYPAFFGDIGDTEFLRQLPLKSSQMVILTVSDPEDELTAIKYLRSINKQLVIVGTLNHVRYLNDLYKAGADYVMMPHLLGGIWMADILKNSKWDRKKFASLYNEQQRDLEKRFISQ